MRKIVPIVLAILFLLTTAWLLTDVAYSTARGGGELPPGSVMRFDPYGSAALYRTLKELGYKVQVLRGPILSRTDTGVLLNIVPPGGGRAILENYSVASGYNPTLLNWIKRGNVLLEFSQNQTHIMTHFHVSNQRPLLRDNRLNMNVLKSEKKKKDKTKANIHPKASHSMIKNRGEKKESVGPWYSIIEGGKNPGRLKQWLVTCPWHSPPIVAAQTQKTFDQTRQRAVSPAELELLRPKIYHLPVLPKGKANPWHILAATHAGPVAIERRYGHGWVIFIASPWPAYNHGVTQQGNLDFILAMVGRRPIIFDEWQLGLGHSATVLNLLSNNGLIPLLLQLFLLLLVFSWSRAGYPAQRTAITPARTDSVAEQIISLGHLYQRSLSRQEIQLRCHMEVRHRLATALRCTPEGLATAAAALRPELAAQVRLMLNQTAEQTDATRSATASSQNIFSNKEQLKIRHQVEIVSQSWTLCEELKRVRYSKS